VSHTYNKQFLMQIALNFFSTFSFYDNYDKYDILYKISFYKSRSKILKFQMICKQIYWAIPNQPKFNNP